jgi:mono/diheme cytochrome c family protein
MRTIYILFSFILFAAFSSEDKGQVLFVKNCAKCHGKDGAKGLFGAKNLQRSVLSSSEYFSIISDGKRFMPSWRKKLSAEDINLVIAYIQTLRK